MEELYQLFPFAGYKVRHIRLQENPNSPFRVFLARDEAKPLLCHACGCPMESVRGRQLRQIEDLRMAERRTFIHFSQLKGRCKRCRKIRLESVDFISQETPHLTRRYSFLLGRICEIYQTARAAELMGHNKMTMWRADLERMMRYFASYTLPPNLTHLSVDEVYAKATREEEENRNDQFFTVITDLRTGKVIWIERSRRKAALDGFFKILGPEGCAKIEVVATDQHDDYARSILEYCPNAIHVLDRFHLVKAFEEAVNETRKRLYKMLPQKEVRELARSKFRFVFLKAAHKRTPQETTHMEKIMKDNEAFYRLELTKERMLTLFNQHDEIAARGVFDELREWIYESGFPELKKWWDNLNNNWQTVENYFLCRVTTAMSEGINNVIKSIKRGAFGFRNMNYFMLKILQRCGFLNSQYMTDNGQWTPKAIALMAGR
jgi:transposase